MRSRCCRAVPAGVPREGLVPVSLQLPMCGCACRRVLLSPPPSSQGFSPCTLPRRPSSHEGTGHRVKGLPYSSASSLITPAKTLAAKRLLSKIPGGTLSSPGQRGSQHHALGRSGAGERLGSARGMGQGRGWGPLRVCQPHKELWSHNDLWGLPS